MYVSVVHINNYFIKYYRKIKYNFKKEPKFKKNEQFQLHSITGYENQDMPANKIWRTMHVAPGASYLESRLSFSHSILEWQTANIARREEKVSEELALKQ